jgi:alkylation response protein AidB-like acyl-CoA dehydrogenase
MATGLEASRAMVRQAAAALDAKSPRATLTAAMAKRFATDTCFGVANDALQLLGGYGYLQVRVRRAVWPQGLRLA